MSEENCNYLSLDEKEIYINFAVYGDTDDEKSAVVHKVLKHVGECRKCYDSLYRSIRACSATEYICNKFKIVKSKVPSTIFNNLYDDLKSYFSKIKVMIEKLKDDIVFDVEGINFSFTKGGSSSDNIETFSECFKTVHFNVTNIIKPDNIPNAKLRLIRDDGYVINGHFEKENDSVFAVFEESVELGDFSVEILPNEDT